MSSFLEVGRIGKPHGVRGDLFVSFTSDLEQRHRVGAQLWLDPSGMGEPLVIVASRAQKDRFVVHFAGIDDRNDAEKLTNKFVYAEPVEDFDALWVHQMIGSQVVDRSGHQWGQCTGILQNPAHDILEIEGGILVPMPFVLSCDGKVTIIEPPDGLREALLGE
jgi:16S rRNA processing protein RimM